MCLAGGSESGNKVWAPCLGFLLPFWGPNLQFPPHAREREKSGAPKTRTRPPGVIAEYFPFLVFPYFFTYLAAAVEIVGSFCLAIGIFARPASLLLAGTMMNALAFHLMKFGPQRFPLNPESRGAYTYEPCLAFLGVTLYFAFAGPGKFAMRPHGF